MKKIFVILSFFVASVSFANDGQALRYLPVQDGGRIKPYDSFARETLQLIYGKTSYQDRAAYEVIMTWILSPQDWHDRPLFEVRHKQVLTQLKLDPEKRWYTGQELFANDAFPLLRDELQAKRESKEKLTPYFQALQRLENQFFVFQGLAAGQTLRLVPPSEGGTWKSMADLQDPYRAAFLDMSKNFVTYIGTLVDASKDVGGAARALDDSVKKFEDLARSSNPGEYADQTKISAEVQYNLFHPFKWAYWSYFIAAVMLLLLWVTGRAPLIKGAWVFVGLGFLIHTYGFMVRVYLAGRPPVSNMYETVIWVDYPQGHHE